MSPLLLNLRAGVLTPLQRLALRNPYARTLLGSGIWGLICLLILCLALSMLLGAWWLQQRIQTQQNLLSQRHQDITNSTANLPRAAVTPPAQSTLLDAPHSRQYLKDLARIQKLILSSGTAVTHIEYKTTPAPKLGLQTRVITISLKDDYPKIKKLAASILAALPHAALQDLHIDRSDTLNWECTATLKFFLLYQGSNSAPEGQSGLQIKDAEQARVIDHG